MQVLDKVSEPHVSNGWISEATKDTRTASTNRFRELDGLRGIGAFLVVVFHYLAGPAVYSHTVSRIQELLMVSPMNIDTFFILSGFLVGGILLQTETSPNYFKTFYMRRIYRILPIYYLWILGFVIVALLSTRLHIQMLPKGNSLGGFVLGHAFFVQNFPHFPYFQTRAHWFDTTWSLAIEEHFYLVIPFLVYRLSRRHLMTALTAVIVLVPVARMFVWQVLSQKNSWGTTYVFTPLRLDALAMGVLLALLWRNPEMQEWFRRHMKWIYAGLMTSMIMAIVFEYMWVKDMHHAGILNAGLGRSSIEVSGVCLVLIALVNQGQKYLAPLRWRLACQFGKISYCVYLIHRGILFLVLQAGFHTKPGLSVSADVLGGLTAFALSWFLADLSWKYLEGPLNRRAHRFAY